MMSRSAESIGSDGKPTVRQKLKQRWSSMKEALRKSSSPDPDSPGANDLVSKFLTSNGTFPSLVPHEQHRNSQIESSRSNDAGGDGKTSEKSNGGQSELGQNLRWMEWREKACERVADWISMGCLAKAEEIATTLLRECSRISDRGGELRCLFHMASVSVCKRRWREAKQFGDGALELAQQLRDRGEELAVLRLLAVANACLGDIAKALDYHVRAARLAGHIGDVVLRTVSLGHAGVILRLTGRCEDAIAMHREQLETSHTHKIIWLEYDACVSLARALFTMRKTTTDAEEKALPYYARWLNFVGEKRLAFLLEPDADPFEERFEYGDWYSRGEFGLSMVTTGDQRLRGLYAGWGAGSGNSLVDAVHALDSALRMAVLRDEVHCPVDVEVAAGLLACGRWFFSKSLHRKALACIHQGIARLTDEEKYLDEDFEFNRHLLDVSPEGPEAKVCMQHFAELLKSVETDLASNPATDMRDPVLIQDFMEGQAVTLCETLMEIATIFDIPPSEQTPGASKVSRRRAAVIYERVIQIGVGLDLRRSHTASLIADALRRYAAVGSDFITKSKLVSLHQHCLAVSAVWGGAPSVDWSMRSPSPPSDMGVIKPESTPQSPARDSMPTPGTYPFALLQLEMGDAYLQHGDYEHAAISYRSASQQFGKFAMERSAPLDVCVEGVSLLKLGQALHLQGNKETSLSELSKAYDVFLSCHSPTLAALTQYYMSLAEFSASHSTGGFSVSNASDYVRQAMKGLTSASNHAESKNLSTLQIDSQFRGQVTSLLHQQMGDICRHQHLEEEAYEHYVHSLNGFDDSADVYGTACSLSLLAQTICEKCDEFTLPVEIQEESIGAAPLWHQDALKIDRPHLPRRLDDVAEPVRAITAFRLLLQSMRMWDEAEASLRRGFQEGAARRHYASPNKYTGNTDADYGRINMICLLRDMHPAVMNAQGPRLTAISLDQSAFDLSLARIHLGRCLSLQTLADVSWRSSRETQALSYQNQCLHSARALSSLQTGHETRLDKRAGVAHCIRILAVMYRESGDYAQSIIHGQEAVRMAENAEDLKGRADSLIQLGVTLKMAHHFDEAVECFDRALVEYKACGSTDGMGVCLSHLGDLHAARGNHEQAMKYHKLCLEQSIDDNNISAVSLCHRNLGMIAAANHEWNLASYYLEQAVDACLESGNLQARMANVLQHLAVISLYCTDDIAESHVDDENRDESPQESKSALYFARCENTFHEIADRAALIEALFQMGCACSATARPQRAHEYFSRCASMCEEVVKNSARPYIPGQHLDSRSPSPTDDEFDDTVDSSIVGYRMYDRGEKDRSQEYPDGSSDLATDNDDTREYSPQPVVGAKLLEGMSGVMKMLASCYYRMGRCALALRGDPSQVEMCYERAWKILVWTKRSTDAVLQAEHLVCIAMARLSRAEDPTSAMDLILRATKVMEDTVKEIDDTFGLGGHAVSVRKARRYRKLLAQLCILYSWMEWRHGDVGEAIQSLSRASAICERISEQEGTCTCYILATEIHLGQGEHAMAVSAAVAALAEGKKVANCFLEAHSCVVAGEVANQVENNQTKASDLFAKALTMLERDEAAPLVKKGVKWKVTEPLDIDAILAEAMQHTSDIFPGWTRYDRGGSRRQGMFRRAQDGLTAAMGFS